MELNLNQVHHHLCKSQRVPVFCFYNDHLALRPRNNLLGFNLLPLVKDVKIPH